jgi:hypothetical protein
MSILVSEGYRHSESDCCQEPSAQNGGIFPACVRGDVASEHYPGVREPAMECRRSVRGSGYGRLTTEGLVSWEAAPSRRSWPRMLARHHLAG